MIHCFFVTIIPWLFQLQTSMNVNQIPILHAWLYWRVGASMCIEDGNFGQHYKLKPLDKKMPRATILEKMKMNLKLHLSKFILMSGINSKHLFLYYVLFLSISRMVLYDNGNFLLPMPWVLLVGNLIYISILSNICLELYNRIKKRRNMEERSIWVNIFL